ncbi:MAG: polyprenyl synthetase family protein [Bryobacteraceae bacterium]
MPGRLSKYTESRLPWIDQELRKHLPLSGLAGAETLNQALRYTLDSGGKRTRPLLTLLAGGLYGLPAEAVSSAACGVEYLHLSSVVLDDLPAMDDARIRRHLPALHVAFGEGIALLAALALYSKAFECFAAVPALVEEAARAIGTEGMIGGQAADLAGEPESRLRKTTALIRFAVRAGAICGGAQAEELCALGRYGELTGEAYQICDDLMDVLAGECQTGKTSGQDARHGRNALSPTFGVGAAFQRIKELSREATETIRRHFVPSPSAEMLCEFSAAILERAADLVRRNDTDGADGGAAGADSGQRNAVAAGEKGSGKPG